jgi:hypothetical protein
LEQKTIDQFIAGLAPDEFEKHRELIHQCLERKMLIRKYTEKTQNDIAKISDNLEIFKRGLVELENIINIQSGITQDLLDDIKPILKSLLNSKPSTN